MNKHIYAIALVGGLLANCAVAAQNLIPTSIADLAGKTCRGYWDFGRADMNYPNLGAFFWEPDETGKLTIGSLSGRVARENYKTLARSEYRPLRNGKIKQVGSKLVAEHGSYNVDITPTGPGTFDVVFSNNSGGGPWPGKMECK